MQFSLFTTLLFLSSIVEATSIAPNAYKLKKGAISDQPIEVLAHYEQDAYDNDWDTYLELSAKANRLNLIFEFDTTLLDKRCNRATLKINTLSEPRNYEKWNFSLRNTSTDSYQKVLTNGEEDWYWKYQEYKIRNLTDYRDANGKVRLKTACKNCTVMDIDLLVLDFHECDESSTSSSSSSESSSSSSSSESAFTLNKSYNVQYDEMQHLVSEGFDIIDIDMEESESSVITSLQSEGKQVICYISTGSFESWRSDADAFDSSLLGKDMDGWDGEKWLDIANVTLLEPIMAARMDRAKAKGCDAIHPDNIDGYINDTGFTLSYADQLNYNRLMAKLAHERGMKIGLKNDVDQLSELVEDFDFAINEECYQYNECSGYSSFIAMDKPVFIIEYKEHVFETYSSDALSNNFYMILKKYDLDSFVVVNE